MGHDAAGVVSGEGWWSRAWMYWAVLVSVDEGSGLLHLKPGDNDGDHHRSSFTCILVEMEMMLENGANF